MKKKRQRKEWDWEEKYRGDYLKWVDGKHGDEMAYRLTDVDWSYRIKDGMPGVLSAGPPPLHPSSRLLLETIAQLEPKSVLDAGCGIGDDLCGVSALLPDDVKLYGVDISQTALDLLDKRWPDNLQNKPEVKAMALPITGLLPRVELAYTHTILMHLNDKRYERSLANLLNATSAHLLMAENWTTRWFARDIDVLCRSGMADDCWPIWIYFRESPEDRRADLLLASKDSELPYPKLGDYDRTMRRPLQAALRNRRKRK